ncbi:MAG: PCRF domain-containing protein, partial [bacterium]
MLLDKLNTLRVRYQELISELSKPEVLSDQRTASKLGRELRNIEGVLPMIDEYEESLKSIDEAKSIIDKGGDSDFVDLAREELSELENRIEELEHELMLALIPPDPDEGKDVIVEIRAGTGGEEAALFASELYRMYSRFAERNKLKMNGVSFNETGLGGFKEVTFELSGDEAYSMMKFESGVHRVQRVP